MTQSDWSEVWVRFRRARELPASARDQVLADAPPRVRAEVEVLLAEDDAEPVQPEAGSKYGKYLLMTRLGEGGMGEVFSARDEELGRLVAIKFVGARARMLPAAMQRLVREAQAASVLNHPNLVTVYDVLRFDEGVALVTELIEGHSLRTFCGASRAVSEVAGWGAQIARALSAVQAGSIVHGDIKPENIMLRPDGLIKVLDFGVASRAGTGGQPGLLTPGTLGYMSPEQTRGEPLTGASDIFSLGVLLYELTRGKHPFLETTAEATTRAIHLREVDLTLPPVRGGRRFSRLLRAMLQKEPNSRPTASYVARELEAIARAGTWQTVRGWVPAVVAAAGALTLGWWLARPGLDVRSPLQFSEPVPLTNYSGTERQPSTSPDGRWLLFVWSGTDGTQDDVFLRSMRSRDEVPVRITDTPQNEFTPVWSPDGRRIAWQQRAMDGGPSALMVAEFDGQSVSTARQAGTVADHEGYYGLGWWPDSSALVTRDAGAYGNPLVKVGIHDGRRTVLTMPKAFDDFRPALSPDGKQFAFLRSRQQTNSVCRLEVRADAPAECREVPFSVDSLAWTSDSRRLLLSARHAMWQFDPRDGAAPVRVRDGQFAGLSATRSGYVFSRIVTDTNIWALDVNTGRGAQLIASSAEDSEPQFSPDGTQILFRSNRSGTYQIYICSRDGSGARALTAMQGHVGSARWSPDGRWIVFDAGRLVESSGSTLHDNVYVVPSGGGAPRRLTDDRDDSIVPGWSADSRTIYFLRGASRETWSVPVDGGPAQQVNAQEMWDLQESADGSWLWYERPATSQGIWRRRARDGQAIRLPGTEHAVYRTWDIAGDALFFLRRGPAPGFVRLTSKQSVVVGPAPKRVLRGPRNMAVSPDGRTILYASEDITLGDLYYIAEHGGR